ncbi:hypothetical protein [Sphingorhabdus lutea]|uniref:hypothetical protein n=1 Tax=Sphingorhabdus lutea TaxID=1913578 RepID=UPI001E4D33BB|nr:hypothetical protein [Sphingorhabdus lutea]
MRRAYYQNNISTFLNDDQEKILGELTSNHNFDLDIKQRDSWLEQIKNLKGQLLNFNGKIFFEFIIPRMGKRVDTILLIDDIVFVLEYKVRSPNYDRQAKDQVLDYTLDLKNFHEGSHFKYIVPILISTLAPTYQNIIIWYDDKIAQPLLSNGLDLSTLIDNVIKEIKCTNSCAAASGSKHNGLAPLMTNNGQKVAINQRQQLSKLPRLYTKGILSMKFLVLMLGLKTLPIQLTAFLILSSILKHRTENRFALLLESQVQARP